VTALADFLGPSGSANANVPGAPWSLTSFGGGGSPCAMGALPHQHHVTLLAVSWPHEWRGSKDPVACSARAQTVGGERAIVKQKPICGVARAVCANRKERRGNWSEAERKLWSKRAGEERKINGGKN
jgi:hypothetical protein